MLNVEAPDVFKYLGISEDVRNKMYHPDFESTSDQGIDQDINKVILEELRKINTHNQPLTPEQQIEQEIQKILTRRAAIERLYELGLDHEGNPILTAQEKQQKIAQDLQRKNRQPRDLIMAGYHPESGKELNPLQRFFHQTDIKIDEHPYGSKIRTASQIGHGFVIGIADLGNTITKIIGL